MNEQIKFHPSFNSYGPFNDGSTYQDGLASKGNFRMEWRVSEDGTTRVFIPIGTFARAVCRNGKLEITGEWKTRI